MFMPCCNYYGFGFTGGFYNPCGFGMPFIFTPFPNLFLQTDLCSVPDYSYNFQSSYKVKTPNFSSFLPQIDLTQATYNTSNTTYDNSYVQNTLSNISNNIVKSFSNRTSNYSSYPTTYSATLSTTKTTSSKTTSQKTDDKKEISYDAKTLEEKWKNSKYAKRSNCKLKSLPSEFFQKVVDISKRINCKPDDLMAVINCESNYTFSASVKNSIGATGLIQFTETTAGEDYMKTSCTKLAKMTETEQLDYVEKYLAHWKSINKLGNSYLDLATLYALVLAPSNAKQEVLYAKGSAGYNGNKSLDTDGKNGITKSEAEARAIQYMA